MSPFSYAGNNPISHIDLLGLVDVDGDGKDDGELLPELEVIAPRPEDKRESRGKLLDVVQGVLTIGEFIPGVQTVAGLVNAGIDVYRGNYASALLSAGSAIPIAGYLFKGAKTAKGITVAANSVIPRILKDPTQNSKAVAFLLRSLKREKHHLIPQAVYKRAKHMLDDAFDIESKFNTRSLDEIFHANHPNYSNYVLNKIQDAFSLNGNNKLSVSQIQNLVNGLRKEVSDALVKVRNGQFDSLDDVFK